MSSTFYLPRKLSNNNETYTETELLSTSNYVVVLAEPGGGKTELMGSLAQHLGTTVITANKFRYTEVRAINVPLVIDAFDELAKLDATGIYQLLSKAESASPSRVYLSSRSSEWGNSATNAFEEFLGHPPLVVRLCEFDEAEQKAIFEHHAQGENFTAFQSEVARFDLETLLPNPQFLKLFADAYIESGRHFTDKRSIFAQAVERLAREVNSKVTRNSSTLSTTQKVDLSSEVFAKLLLSGAEGVGTSEATEDRIYPLLQSLFINSSTAADDILATRLFKPGDGADQHRPVHKIVTEYCAASYLTKRIADPVDSLTLPKCIAIIAPNTIVRDELRGLLGWMAALGNKPVEEAAIDLDPYAVLANGDPSQIEHSSKRLLVKRLKEFETKDPYFRRGDFWRRFSVAGFFTQEVVDEIKPLLSVKSDGHLRDLILELLKGSPACKHLREELRQVVLAADESENARLLASECLSDIVGYDPRADLVVLVAEASPASLRVATSIIETLGELAFERDYLANLFRACANLYPGHQEHSERTIGARYFIKRFIRSLALDTIEWLLDELTKSIACNCGKQYYECDCRNGISKIVGSMLDRYFDLAIPPFDPIRVWQWVGNLNFHENRGADQSKAVQVLQKDNGLRQGIIAHVFGKLTDRSQIKEIKLQKFDWHSHSGLYFQIDDYKFVADLAFKTDNADLWASFIAGHQYHRNIEKKGPDSLRRQMREHALEKPSFMREWVKSNRVAAQQFEQQIRALHFRHSRRVARRLRRQGDIRAANIKYIQDNRELVESGGHWGFLNHFAQLVLMEPKKIEQEVGDETLIRNALRNCLDFLAPHVPDLLELAELQCASQGSIFVRVLYAACLEVMREKGNLEEVDLQLLRALRTNIRVHYDGVCKEDHDALKAEVDRLIFPDAASAENFLRQYVEPQLAKPGCNHPEVWLLRSDDVFSDSRSALSIEWLRRFPQLALGPLDTLFEIAAQHGNRNDLKEIIAARCVEFICCCPNSTGSEYFEQRRTFWFVRAWYFLSDAEICWRWLKANKETVLILHELSGSMGRSDYSYWPKLTSNKIGAILEAYFDKWPKVDLPGNWGTSSPKAETAYRFLTEVIWLINSDDPDDAIPILNRLLADPRFTDLHKGLKSILADQFRKSALRDFEPPTPQEIVNLLDHDEVVTVGGLRQLVIQELQDFQKAIDGGEFNSASRFYEKGDRLGEVRSTEIIAERLNLRLEPKGISVTPEHQLKDANRSDFTVSKMISGKRRLLVTEVKGQWHKDLYTAASAQLHERYSIHPDAEQQGIYLAIWFGAHEEVAARKHHGITSAQELKSSIEATLPPELTGLINIFVLDVSKPQ